MLKLMQLKILIERMTDAEIYRFDFFKSNGVAEFYNTWECDRTFEVKCPFGQIGSKHCINGMNLTVKDLTVGVLCGCNVWVVDFQLG